MQGHLDSPLTEKGIAQASSLELLLAREPLSAVYTSDLGRCLETTRLILGKRGSEPDLACTTDPRLRELCLGDMQGLNHVQAQERYPEAWVAFSTYQVEVVMPSGESRLQCLERVLLCLDEVVGAALAQPDRDPEASILVVTHGGVLNMFLRHVLGIPLNAPRRFAVPNGTLNRFQCQGGVWRMVTWGETHPAVIEPPTASESERTSSDIG
jgi:probable phosphoglycerate mutase